MKFIISLFIFLLFQSYLDADEITIIAVGDIMLGRYIGKDMEKKGYYHPFEKMKIIISSADIAFGNLECPISSTGSPTKDKFCFRASTHAVKGLVYSGFDILCLANNHSMDYGKKALWETMRILKENHLLTTGGGENFKLTQEPAIFEVKGIKVGFLGYDCTYLEMYDIRKSSSGAAPREIISRDIARAKKPQISWRCHFIGAKSIPKNRRNYR